MIDRTRLEAIVREAGRIALSIWPGRDVKAGESEDSASETRDSTSSSGTPVKLAVWEKTPGNPVSSADLAVDAFLKAELSALLPAAGWLSEETADDPRARAGDLVWLVDPIDGTRDYIHGRSGWAVSVALVNTGRPLLGVLHAPARGDSDAGGEFWYGEAGKGALRNGARLRASTRSLLVGARVPARHMSVEDADLVMVDQPNSIALRIAMVAANEADLLATLRWGFEWDIAAAGLIAREAGAAVTDIFGQPLNYNKRDPRAFGVLVTAPAIHGAAVARLADRARRMA